MNIDPEWVEIDIERVRDRRFKRNSNEFEVGELSIETLPIQSINNTDSMYNLNNSTLGNHTNTDTNTYTESESDVFWTIVGPVLMIILCVLNTRSHIPSSQYHRGAMIRRQAERVWAIERVKTERQGVPIETRKTQINDNLRKMKVVSKCASTGHCILGTVEVEEHKINNDSGEEGTIDALSMTGKCSTDSENIEAISDSSSTANEDEESSSPASTTDAVASNVVPVAAASPKSESKYPESPGKAERRPLLSADSEDLAENPGSVTETKEVAQSPSNNSCATTATPSSYDDFDDDEDVCPICLDNFEIGDIVIFSRHNHSSCSHVFHEDCLSQWLLEQRENECPICRACFISDQTTDPSSVSTSDTDENSSSLSDEPEDSSTYDETIVDEISGDIEEGKTNSASSNSTHNEDNSGGDCIGDCSGGSTKARHNDHKFVDGEENDSLKIDVLDEMEQGFTYVIVKGLVQRIPSRRDS